MKKLAALILLVCMLLCLFACGDSKEDTDKSTGDKNLSDLGFGFGSGDKDASDKDASNKDSSNKDSSDKDSGDKAANIQDNGNNDSGSGIFKPDSQQALEASLYRKYKDIIDALENERFANAVQLIAELSNAGNDTADKTPFAQIFESEWYLYGKNEKYTLGNTVSIKDGNVTANGTVYTFLENSSSERSLSGWLVKDGVIVYYLSAGKGEYDNIPYMEIYSTRVKNGDTIADECVGTYCNIPVAGNLLFSWRNLDDNQTDMPRDFYFGRQDAYFGNEEYKWSIEQSTETSISVKIADKYTFDAEMRGEHILGTLVDTATGNTAYYYTYTLEYDRSWKEYIYPRAVKYLNTCLEDVKNGYKPSFYSELGESGKTFSGNDAWKKLYEIFESLGGYKDSKKYLARFTILEDAFISMNEITVDNMGNKSDYNRLNNTYNSLGQLVSDDGDKNIWRTYGGQEGYTKYFTYDELGRVTKVQEGSGNYVDSVVELKYDAQGRLTGGTYTSNSATNELSYTYDSQGRLSENIAWRNNDRYKHTYSYDDQNRVVKIVTLYGWIGDYERCRYTTTFEYAPDGSLAKEIYIEEEYDAWYERYDRTVTVTYTYECNSDGKPVKAAVSEERANGAVTWASKTREYYYTDLYFFD